MYDAYFKLKYLSIWALGKCSGFAAIWSRGGSGDSEDSRSPCHSQSGLNLGEEKTFVRNRLAVRAKVRYDNWTVVEGSTTESGLGLVGERRSHSQQLGISSASLTS